MKGEETAIANPVGPYSVFMVALCVFALVAMAVETALPADSEGRIVLGWVDLCVCGLFLADFLWSLWNAPGRWRYFVTWGWIDLLSSVPMVDFLRIGRSARILRVLRLLRGVRASKVLAAYILTKRAQSAFLAAVLLSLVLVTFSSVAILQFEQGDGANIHGAGDALWWSLVVLTTGDYGGQLPISPEGRVVGTILAIGGVGLLGVLSGFMASWFISPGQDEEKSGLESLRMEITALRSSMERVVHEPTPIRRADKDHEADRGCGP